MSDYLKSKSTFCALPFTHLATHPDGTVTPCCESSYRSKNGSTVLNLNEHSVEQIRNSDSFNKLRSDMLNGIENSACDFCYSREKQDIDSKRIRENKKWGVNEDTFEYFTQNPLIYAEMRLGNTCNLKCLICHPWSSSKWNEDAEVVGYKKVKLDRTWFKDHKIYNQISQHSHSLKHVWFNGGEPMLIKEHYDFLEDLADNNTSNEITLEYHTNGTILPDRLTNIWKHFKSVEVNFSIDDIGDRLYYQRYPSQHSTSVKTITKLKERVDINTVITILPTVSLYNVFNLDKLYRFYNEDIGVNIDIINFLETPDNLAVWNLPEQFKRQLVDRYTGCLPQCTLDELQFNLFKKKSKGLDKFINYTKSLDNHRNISILDYLPEYTRYFKGYI